MQNMNEWMNQAIRATGGFILWMVLLLVAIGLILLVWVVVYAARKELVEKVKNGGKK